MKQYLNEKEVSRITGLSIQTLRNQRYLHRGIPYIKLSGRCVRYDLEDVLSHMQDHRVSFDV